MVRTTCFLLLIGQGKTLLAGCNALLQLQLAHPLPQKEYELCGPIFPLETHQLAYILYFSFPYRSYNPDQCDCLVATRLDPHT